jgi:methanogenic corrinoid protein MtbC1
MDPVDRHAADALDSVQSALVEWTFGEMLAASPEFAERCTPRGHRLWRQEIRQRLRHLAEAIACRCPRILLDDLAWSRQAFDARLLEVDDLRLCLDSLRKVLCEQLPASLRDRCVPIVDAALSSLKAPVPSRSRGLLDDAHADDPSLDAARRYLLHLLEREQQAAINLVLRLQEEGRPLVEIHQQVLAPALAEVGRMWHLEEASIADEHFSTAATRLALAELRARARRRHDCGRRVLCTAVGGDLHDLGIRMVADAFESEGWQAECLGADMPVAEIIATVRGEGDQGLDLLAVAANSALMMRPIADLFRQLGEQMPSTRPRTIVGGRPFQWLPELVAVVGADAAAASPAAALAIAAEWFGQDAPR